MRKSPLDENSDAQYRINSFMKHSRILFWILVRIWSIRMKVSLYQGWMQKINSAQLWNWIWKDGNKIKIYNKRSYGEV